MTREHPYTHQQNTASFQPRSPLRQPFNPNGWNQPTSHSTSTPHVAFSDSNWLNPANPNHSFFSSELEHETETAQPTPPQWSFVGNDIAEVQGNSPFSSRSSGQSFNTDLASPLLNESGQLAQVTNNDSSFQASNSTDQTNDIAWEGGRAVAAGLGFIEPGRWLAERAATRIDQFRTARLENRVSAIANGIVHRLEAAPDQLDLIRRVDAARQQYPGTGQQGWREFVSRQTDPQVREVLSQFPERERIRRIKALQELRKAIREGSPLRGSRTRRLFSELVRGTRPASTETFRGGAIALAEGSTRPFRSGIVTDPRLVRRALVISRLTGFNPRAMGGQDTNIRNRGFLFRVLGAGEQDTHAEPKTFASRLFRSPRLVAVSQAVCRPSPFSGGCGQNTRGRATLTRSDRFIVAPEGRNRLSQYVPARLEHYRADGRMRTIPLSSLLSMTPQQRSAYARTSAQESVRNRRAESWSRQISERLRDTRSQGTSPFRNNSRAQPPQTPRTSATQARTGGTRQSRPPRSQSGGQAPRSGGTQARTGGTRPSRPPGGTARTQPPQALRTGSGQRRTSGSGNPRPPGSGGNAPHRRPPAQEQPRTTARASGQTPGGRGNSPRASSGGASAAMRGVRRLGIAGQVVGLGMDAVDIKRAVDRDGGRFGTNAKRTTTRVAGGLAGGAAGAAAGAAIGAAFGGVGAVPGAAIGFALGTVGSIGGSRLGDALGRRLFR
ncbi:hypothetical protein [Leptothermofonsia sp. ETS-13]|uniref:hypothetical protein n=1 Tax=Leptothermofonsia sp. ETS-13 TaxID=3035696 RepID=UPI003BA10AC0